MSPLAPLPARAHQTRVGLRLGGSEPLDQVSHLVRDALGTDWQTLRLAADSGDLVAVGPSRHAVGTEAYADEAFACARALRETAWFVRVEADVPVPWRGPDPRLAPDALSCSPDSARKDWARDAMRWSEALDMMDPEVRGGVGVSVGHPDSGYTLHPNVGTPFDLQRDWDVIDDDDDAKDDLVPNPHWPLPNPGHGTSTASVIAGRGVDPAGVVGVAQASVIVPVRATESVVQLFDSDVAAAVEHSRAVGCQVVSMSLGGAGFFGLRAAIDRAVAAGMIVMAAAGNVVRYVTAPAAYDSCIAVAATGPGDEPWSGSSRGPAVDVSMPGSCVWVAGYDGSQPTVGRTHGTSYAVAHLAGAASLWLAQHGHARLVVRYGAHHVQAAFLATLRMPGVCVAAPGWDPWWGLGRVDIAALVSAALPSADDVADVRANGAADEPGRLLAATTGRDARRCAALVQLDGADEPELVYREMAGQPGRSATRVNG